MLGRQWMDQARLAYTFSYAYLGDRYEEKVCFAKNCYSFARFVDVYIAGGGLFTNGS